MKKTLALVLTFVFLLAGAHGALAQDVKWRLVTHAMPGTEQQRIAEVFCETVKTLSGGKFVIEPYAAGVLFPVFESFDGVATMVVRHGLQRLLAGKDPLFTSPPIPDPSRHLARGAYLGEARALFSRSSMPSTASSISATHDQPHNEQLMSGTPILHHRDREGKEDPFLASRPLYRSLAAPRSPSPPPRSTRLPDEEHRRRRWTFWDENMRMGLHEGKPTGGPRLPKRHLQYFPLW